jgi:hypothetical protein
MPEIKFGLTFAEFGQGSEAEMEFTRLRIQAACRD